MTSKLETRIATQKYHGISSAQWWRLTDEEQEALIREATNPVHVPATCDKCGSLLSAVTWTCILGKYCR